MWSFINALRLNKNWVIYAVVLLASLFIASAFPITNDESYYIAFAKHLQLSYVDAPPFVAYLNIIQIKLDLTSPLAQRSLVIVLHLLATLLLMAIVYHHCVNDKDLTTRLLLTFLIAYVVPIFGLFGIFILPDSGLILSLSMMLWATDNIIRSNYLGWKNILILGIGLGIGLLSKYHILPLGGGMMLGLLLELSWASKFSWSTLAKLTMSIVIGLLCALPVLIWNFEHHFASFIFQFQHGFSDGRWRLGTMLAFIACGVIYLTPWFAYILVRRGLLTRKHAYMLIPFLSLLIILLFSSLRKSVLPHWISPAFWLLIPYAVIDSDSKSGQLQSLMKACKYTALIWVALIVVLLLPNGLLNVKELSKKFNPDAGVFKDLLLWQELPDLMQENAQLTKTIATALHQKANPGCKQKKPIIGTYRWFWTSQIEYHQMFPGAKILNLDPFSSNFYLWRDNWADYANCHILLMGGEDAAVPAALSEIMTINNEYVVHGLGDYRTLDLQVINITLKDSDTLQKVQQRLVNHPHY